MKFCWRENPNERPDFSDCKNYISSVLRERSPEDYSSFERELADAWVGMVMSRPQLQEANADRQPMPSDPLLESAYVGAGSQGIANEGYLPVTRKHSMMTVVIEGNNYVTALANPSYR